MSNTKAQVIEIFLKLTKSLGRQPSLPELKAKGVSPKSIEWNFGNKKNLIKAAKKQNPKVFKGLESSTRAAMDKEASQKKKANFIKIYLDRVKAGSFFPTKAELAEHGITRDSLKHYFKTIKALRDATKMEFPEAFSGVVDLDKYLADKNQNSIKKQLKSSQTFFITTAVNGQEADENFINSIKTFCNKNDAKLLILPCHDPAHNLSNTIEWHFDSVITETKSPIIFEETELNKNMVISGIRVTAKQINPTTGLGRITKGTRSFVFASPKQSLEFIPNSNRKLPHAMMTTGACTKADYSSTRGNSQRTAYLAEFDHVIGGLIVEIQDSKIYHFRQVQADKKTGAFIDLGIEYNSKGLKRVASKLILGDIHAAAVSETALKATEEMMEEFKVDTIVIHDLFDGDSVNHHEEKNLISQAIKAKMGRLSLSDELKKTSAIVDRLLSKPFVKLGVIPDANHNNFIHRWLQRGRFKDEPQNFALGCKLAAAYVDGKDPLQEGLKSEAPIKHAKKLKWLAPDEDYIVAGVQLGSHGDLGPAGTRGSAISLERALVDAIIAHSHTPRIIRKLVQVGTLSELYLGYNKGPSSWMHCNAVLYPNGTRQLINIINGQWRLKK